MPSYYEVLGIEKKASTQDIHQAYGQLMRRHHPDKNSGVPADEQFYIVRDAYETLSDPAKRQAYDAQLEANSLSHTLHPLQAEIRQQFKALDVHLKILQTLTIPWFCYNQTILVQALDQIHTKSGFFLYGFLTGDDVSLIQAFLNHTLTLLDNLQKTSAIEDKFKVILNYVTALQDDEQAEALKELYGLQIDAIVNAHVAITSKEVPFYITSGLHEFDIQINRIAAMQFNGQKKQAQQELLRTLHTFRERVKEQLGATFEVKETLRQLTDCLSKLSYQEQNIDQDNTTLSTHHPLPEIPAKLPTRSLKTILVNVLLWFLNLSPRLQQRVKHYFAPPQTTQSEASTHYTSSDITAAMTHFLNANQDDSLPPLEETNITWATQHQVPPEIIWSPQQRLRSNHLTNALSIFRENNHDIFDPSQIISCEIDSGERYLLPTQLAYTAIELMQHEILETQQEQILFKLQAIEQKWNDWQAALPKRIDDKVKQELAELTKEVEENGKKLADQDKKLADQEQELADQEKKFSKQDKKLADQEQELSDQKKKFSEQEKKLTDQDKKLADQDKKLADMDQMKAQLALLMSMVSRS